MLVTDPDTLAEPEFSTRTRFFYTDKGLYVAAVMKQPPQTLVRRLPNRDQELNRDSFGITLDTSGSGLDGCWFELNLGGTKTDGRVPLCVRGRGRDQSRFVLPKIERVLLYVQRGVINSVRRV